MSVTVRCIAKMKGVSQRTARRWCEAGLVPGAYRTEGGHWRVAHTHAQMKTWAQFLAVGLPKRRRQPAPEPPEVLRKLGKVLPAIRDPDSTYNLANKAQLLLLGVAESDGEGYDKEGAHLFARDPELAEEFHKPISEFLTEDAWKFAEKRPEMVKVGSAAMELYRSEKKLTASALAAVMGISRATLYRRYPDFRMALNALTAHRTSRVDR